MAKQFWYVIDLDERGVFSAHVEDDQGETVWEASNAEDGGEFWPVEDGFMKHGGDVAGLEEYLKEMGVIPDDARLGSEAERSGPRGSRMQWPFKQGRIGDSARVTRFVDSLLAE